MTRAARSLAIVQSSLPQVCAVCGNQRGVLRLRLDKPDRPHRPQVGYPCPHCTPITGAGPIPIYVYPMRTDQPREAAR